MAKGFTVKASAPKKKEAEWDIDAIKARMKGKRLSSVYQAEDVLLSF